MSWFRKKGKYWYFVEKIDGKENQHYIGNDQAVLEGITGKGLLFCPGCKEKRLISLPVNKKIPDDYYCSDCNKSYVLLPNKKVTIVKGFLHDHKTLAEKGASRSGVAARPWKISTA